MSMKMRRAKNTNQGDVATMSAESQPADSERRARPISHAAAMIPIAPHAIPTRSVVMETPNSL